MAENGFRAFQKAKMSPQDMQLNNISCIFLKKSIKYCSSHSKRRPKIDFQDRLSLNADQKYCRMLLEEHSAIRSIFIKLTFAIKIFFFVYF